MRGVAMAKDFYFGAREASTVDNAGVIQFVGDDEVIFAENG